MAPVYAFQIGDRVQVLEDLQAYPDPRPAFVGVVTDKIENEYMIVQHPNGEAWAIFDGEATLL